MVSQVFCSLFCCTVGGHLVSKAVTENVLLLEKLSKYLDKESRVVKFWKHLAYVLEVPPEETQKFDIYTEHSPTEDLFNFLEGNRPDLYVWELKKKLQAVYRNDIIEDLQKGMPKTYTTFMFMAMINLFGQVN